MSKLVTNGPQKECQYHNLSVQCFFKHSPTFNYNIPYYASNVEVTPECGTSGVMRDTISGAARGNLDDHA